MQKLAGFTLIEILVAITIMGVIFGVIITSSTAVQRFARDTQRQSDLKAIQSALQHYYADNNSYPDSLTKLTSGAKVYLQKIPVDPVAATNYSYQAKGNECGLDPPICHQYCLFTKLESPPNPLPQIPSQCLPLPSPDFNLVLTQP